MAVPVLRPRQFAGTLGSRSGSEPAIASDRPARAVRSRKRRRCDDWKNTSGSRSRRRSARSRLAAPALAQNEQFIPALVYRTGAYAPNGVPYRQRHRRLLQAGQRARRRHQRRQDRRSRSASSATPPIAASNATSASRARARPARPSWFRCRPASPSRSPRRPRPTRSRSSAHGLRPRPTRATAAVFQWNFPLLGTYWTAADIILQHIAKKEGGWDKLKGKKIALVYHNSPYGKEPIALLQKRAQMHGFETAAAAGDPSGRRAEGDLAADPRRTARLRAAVGLGRDELDRHQGSGRGRLSRARRCTACGGRAPSRTCGRPRAAPRATTRATLQHSAGQFKLHEDLKKHLYDKGKGVGQVGGDRRGALLPRPDHRHARRRGDPHRAGEVRQEAVDRRAGALGLREPRPDRGAPQGARIRGRAPADQGELRRPRGRAHGPHPDLGRQELEDHVRLVHRRRQRARPDGRRNRPAKYAAEKKITR